MRHGAAPFISNPVATGFEMILGRTIRREWVHVSDVVARIYV